MSIYLFRAFSNFFTKLILIALIGSLLISTGLTPPKATASGVNGPIHILEIVEANGTDSQPLSELKPLLGTKVNPNYIIDTVRMKTFVALRDELDGKYDAIYIGKGSYSSTRATNNVHNTTAIQNDITLLKMNEISKYYIERGLPVIVYSQRNNTGSSGNGALYQSVTGNLKAAFLAYAQKTGTTPDVNASYVPISTLANVIFVGSADLASTAAFLSKTNLSVTGNVRPHLEITSKPIDYTVNQANKYVAGDMLTYRFDVTNVGNLNQRSLVANLYIGIDNVLKFGANQLIVTQPITTLTGNTITYRLPKGYSGVHYWRLEIVDQGNINKLRDMQTGVVRFQDEATKINVLQIFQDNGDTTSSLLKENNMKQAYLKSEDYEITIKTMSMNTFNSTGYKSLNGYYDMLIFGFADSYNGAAKISQAAADKVKEYIKTGQSVMFTHDTVFENNQTWITNFQQVTGQVDPKTNMGLGAPETSKTTKKINEGLLTRFPFNVSSSIPSVNLTHDQYFALNLEDEKLIPWYNITGGSRDNDDSWNHYYTYSYGNVTYSGTGHTNANFPDWEQKLFVNTMYRAFIGSNHAPVLSVASPVDYSVNTSIIPSYNDILVNYTADDFDLSDRTLTHKVTFKYRATATSPWTIEEKVINEEKRTGEIINLSYPNPLPNGGDLIVYITATDKNGALDSKTINNVVVKIIANADVSRSISSDVIDNQIERDMPFTINYTITPKPIKYQAGINHNDLVLRGFQFTEAFPSNLDVQIADVSSNVTNKKRTGSQVGGYTLSGGLPNISYRKDGNFFIADPITFAVTVTPKKNGNYLLANSNVNFKDFYVDNNLTVIPVDRTLQFASYAVEAVTRIKTLSLADLVIAKDEQSKLNPIITPDEVTNPALTWTSNHPETVSVDVNDGVVTGKMAGSAIITAKTKDGSNLTSTATVTVIVPGLNITGPEAVDVGDEIPLGAILVSTTNENILNTSWTLSSGDSSKASLNFAANSLQSTITGLNVGTVTVTLAVTTDKRFYTDTRQIKVEQPVILNLPSDIQIGAGQTYDLYAADLAITPPGKAAAVSAALTWSSSDSSVVTVGSNSGVLTGKASGESTITVNYQKLAESTPVTASIKVIVVDLDLPAEITIPKGYTYDIKSQLTTLPQSLGNLESKLTWTDESSNTTVSLVDTNGNIKSGDRSGTEVITVTYRQTAGGPVIVSKTVRVNVVDISLTGPVTYKMGDPVLLDLRNQLRIFPDSLKDTIMRELTWSDDSSKNFLSVSSTGIITGLNAGTEVVTATYTPAYGIPITAHITVVITKRENSSYPGGDRY
jgi:uncharacterized protein YjdB